MFSGIIKDTGKIKNLTRKADSLIIEILSVKINKDLKIGDSISIDGVCQTVIEKNPRSFKVQAVAETLKKTTFSFLKINQKVNLEPSLRLHDRLHGHLVYGHIDETGQITKLKKNKESSTLTIKFPPSISKYLSYKGSIAINGVSLTISDLEREGFEVTLIPHTLQSTALKNLKIGDPVNLEVDIIARYTERLLKEKEAELSYHWLKERNFI